MQAFATVTNHRQIRTMTGRVLASAGLVLLLPMLLAIALLVRVGDGGPVFYCHPRIGRGGRIFLMWKFRTMTCGADRRGPSLTVHNDQRVTPVGRRLRRWRLDELPQLWNVVLGEMELVGPRPEFPSNAEKYPSAVRPVLSVCPGLTDPGTLGFLYRETEIISAAADPVAAYLDFVVPPRARLSLAYHQRATVWSDLTVLASTFYALLRPSAAVRCAYQLVPHLLGQEATGDGCLSRLA